MTNSHRSQLTTILNLLPTELLIVIVKYAGWKGVLRIRRTCKSLEEISRTRDIWMHYLSSYTSARPRIHYLEQRPSAYTSRELEWLFLRWKSAELGWRMEPTHLLPSRQHILTVHAVSACLVKGGRWLLVTTRRGSLKYFDLDSNIADDMANDLIPDQVEGPLFGSTISCSSPDVDESASNLTFNLAFFISSILDDSQAFKFYIWKISLDCSGATLKAERLASFSLDSVIIYIQSVSLRGSSVAISGFAGHSFTSAIDWTKANGNVLTYQRKTMWIDPGNIFLLPDGRLLNSSGNRLRILDCLQMIDSTQMPHYQPDNPSAIIADISGQFHDAQFSAPFLCHDSIRFSMACADAIYGIIIPLSRDSPAKDALNVVKLVDLTPDRSRQRTSSFVAVGYHCAVLDREFVVFAWPDEPEDLLHPTVRNKTKSNVFSHLSPWPLLMDEASGRILRFDTNNNYMMVELALPVR